MALIDIKGGSVQKPVQRYAPDAFIHINGFDYVINGATNLNVKFNDDIKTINISGSTDSPPAKASVTLAVTRSEDNKYFYKGQCIFFPMMEIEIFLKGKYNLTESDGTIIPPPAYRQFHGVITSVSDDYSGDQHSISLECEDLLYFLRIMKMASHPSILYAASTGADVTIHKSTFETGSVKDVIRKLCNTAFGGNSGENDETKRNNVANFIPETFGEQAFIGANQNNTLENSEKLSPEEFVDTQKRTFSDYWARRFKIVEDDGSLSNKDSNILPLIIFGYAPPEVQKDPTDTTNTVNQTAKNDQVANSDDSLIEQTQSLENRDLGQKTLKGSQSLDASAGGTSLNESDAAKFDKLIDQAAPFAQISQINVVNTEYQTLLDLAIVCRDYVHYEFYMSLDGSIIFKPPFYNMDVKYYRPQVILDRDVISFSFKETDDVITFFSVKGNISDLINTPPQIQQTGTAADFKLAKQFLGRYQTTDLQMAANVEKQINQANFLAIYAQNLMDVHNAKRFQATITIPGTPEIKLGYPVYIESRDCFGYVTNISHSFSFGNSFTTTLQLTAIRYQCLEGKNKVIRPTGIDSQVVNGSFSDEEMLNKESLGLISGTGTDRSNERAVFDYSQGDNLGNFWESKVQRISDIDGYDLVGIIGFARDTMLDSSGNIILKSTAPTFDNSINLDLNAATQISNIDVTTGKNVGTTKPSDSTVKSTVSPTANKINSVDVNTNNKSSLK